MRLLSAVSVVVLAAGVARAACPGDCTAGGGPPATDCFVAWSGVSTTAPTCVDGTACDADGAADGTCTFAVEACVNVAGLGTCTPGTLAGAPTVRGKDGNAQTLSAALAGLDPGAAGCAPVLLPVPVKAVVAGLKPGKSKLVVTAASGGRRDKDKLTFTCQPSTAPVSLATDVQPILGERIDGTLQGRCAYSGCHDRFFQAGGQSLEPGDTIASSVNVAAVGLPKLKRVVPGSIKKSLMARKVLGVGIGPTAVMPQGCPSFPPAGGCLTEAERFAILYWIANGAQP